MSPIISIDSASLARLDLAPAESVLQAIIHDPQLDPHLSFAIDFPRELGDPRELSEIPEVRLWFVRLDTVYPWLPLYLDWKAGELGRYVAMLIPHQFHPTEGIQYNPESLEIWVMAKVFTLQSWLGSRGLEGKGRIKAMTQVLGYELEEDFFSLL